MWFSTILLWLIPIFIGVHSVEDTERIVEEAVLEALEKVNEDSKLEQSVPDDTIVSSQKANDESKKAQFTGEVMEEATKILVRKHGMGIIPRANAIIEGWKEAEERERTTEAPNVNVSNVLSRTKRYTNDNPKCASPPVDCSNQFHSKTRSITGLCNNRNQAMLGSSVTPVRRLLGAVSYDDDLQSVRSKSITGKDLPSTRQISNILHDDTGNEIFSAETNHLHMQIGQFIAHDIIFMPSSVANDGSSLNCSACDSPRKVSKNCAPITIPKDDKYFKTPCMRLTRALNGQKGFGIRTPINQNTHFLDLSAVYGSEDCEARTVRSFKDGRLATFNKFHYDLPPQNKHDSNCLSKDPSFCFTCGDFRNSLQPALIPIHTIFIKEHNRIADIIKSRRPAMNDEDIFQLTRKIMIGMWQHIVYNEYLPKYFTPATLQKFDLVPLKSGFYQNYDAKQDPSLSAEFAAAAFRFGHSQVRSEFIRLNAQNETRGRFNLGSNIFYADQNYLSGLDGWEPVLNGLMKIPGMEPDRYFSFPIRNQLFEIRKQKGSGVDLVAVNIMRGRDVGLLPYYQYRSLVGLKPIRKWNDLDTTFSSTNIAALKRAYADPRDIDLYTGLIMENHVPGGQLGPTATYIVAEQFKALKTGDRFYYESQVNGTDNFSEEQLVELRKARLAKMICTNSKISRKVNSEIFDMRSKLIECSSIPDLSIEKFLNH